MTFLERLDNKLESLQRQTGIDRFVVAYSGGVDSHVLLVACQLLNRRLRAIHVHHGLQQVADHWVDHCQAICRNLDVPFDAVYVDASQKPGKRQSPEEAARIARYQALYKELEQDECLLTAQHRDDQAETLLIQLLRSGSAAGLAGMPALTNRSGYYHARPLLEFTRSEIESFAYEHDLDWIEDPSNQDRHFDRNYLRQDIIPLLEKRWPELNAQLATVAEMQAGNLEVLNDMAGIDLANNHLAAQQVTRASRYQTLSVLSVSGLQQLSENRRLNMLRFWVTHSLKAIKLQVLPTRKLLKEITDTLVSCKPDAEPRLEFASVEFRRYRDGIYLLKASQAAIDHDLEWQSDTELHTDSRCFRRTRTTSGVRLKPGIFAETLTVRIRQGGEKIRLPGRDHRTSLKKLLNESGIPPWDRQDLPLIYWRDQLIAVADLWVSADHMAHEDEAGWRIDIAPSVTS